MPHLSQRLPHREKGAVLLIGMVLLAIMMMGAVSIMTASVSDEKLAGNSKASADAFFAAEAGYIAAIEHLSPKADPNDPDSDVDAQQAKSRWNSLYAMVKDFDDISDWESNGTIEPTVLNQGNHTVFITPAFRTVMKDGNPVTERIPGKIKFFSRGTVGGATRTIGFDLQGGGGTGLPPAPAPLSCFGASCVVSPGAAKGKGLIDGRNHDLPSNTCTGQSCWLDPIGWDSTANAYTDPANAYSVPSVFLDKYTGSNLKTNGGNNYPYIGQDHLATADDNPMSQISFGGSKDASSVWTEIEYIKNNLQPPTYDEYFGNDLNDVMSDIKAREIAEIAAGTHTVLGTADNPKMTVLNAASTSGKLSVNSAGVLIVDGSGKPEVKKNGKPGDYESVSFTGTGFYAGLIILRNCSQLDTGGNVSIYGAVLVDAKTADGEDCGPDYEPFSAGGHPDIKYSLEALNNAGVGTSGGLIGDNLDWYEVIEG